MTEENKPATTEQKTPVTPPYRLDDPRFKWVPSYQTDVQKTWMRFGWTPTKR